MSINTETLDKKLNTLMPTQESIQTVSLWCLHYKDSHGVVAQHWLQQFKLAPSRLRLSLLYLANDIIQNARKKRLEFYKDTFVPVIRDALALIRTDPIRRDVERIIDIWKEREIYSSEVLEQLIAVLNSQASKEVAKVNEDLCANFKPEELVGSLEQFQTLEFSIAKAQALLASLKYDFGSNLRSHLKDRQQCSMISHEVDDTFVKLTDFVNDLEKHIKHRAQLIASLEVADMFYDTQLTDAGTVETTFRQYGNRVKAVRLNLEEVRDQLPSRDPTPPRDAPSPSPNDDPFAQGVEAVIHAKKWAEQCGTVDMDIEEDGCDRNAAINTTLGFVRANDPRISQRLARIADGGATPTQDEPPMNSAMPSASSPRPSLLDAVMRHPASTVTSSVAPEPPLATSTPVWLSPGSSNSHQNQKISNQVAATPRLADVINAHLLQQQHSATAPSSNNNAGALAAVGLQPPPVPPFGAMPQQPMVAGSPGAHHQQPGHTGVAQGNSASSSGQMHSRSGGQLQQSPISAAQMSGRSTSHDEFDTIQPACFDNIDNTFDYVQRYLLNDSFERRQASTSFSSFSSASPPKNSHVPPNRNPASSQYLRYAPPSSQAQFDMQQAQNNREPQYRHQLNGDQQQQQYHRDPRHLPSNENRRYESEGFTRQMDPFNTNSNKLSTDDSNSHSRAVTTSDVDYRLNMSQTNNRQHEFFEVPDHDYGVRPPDTNHHPQQAFNRPRHAQANAGGQQNNSYFMARSPQTSSPNRFGSPTMQQPQPQPGFVRAPRGVLRGPMNRPW